MPIVKMPDGTLIDVPDNASPKELAELELLATSSGQTMAPQGGAPAQPAAPQQPAAALSGPELAKRRLGILLRGGATGVGSTVGMVGDALNTGINMATGSKLGMPSQAIQRGLDTMGLPKPQGEDEHLASFLSQIGGGLFDPAMGGVLGAIRGTKALGGGGALYNAPQAEPIKNEVLRRASEEGYVFPPSEAGKSFPQKTLETIAGKDLLADKMAFKNVPVTQQLARRAAGLPKDAPLDRATLSRAIDDTYNAGYAPLRDLGEIATRDSYHRALNSIVRKHPSMTRSFPGAEDNGVRAAVNQFRVPTYRSDDALQAIRSLREDSDEAFAAGNNDLGFARREIAEAIEDNIEAYLAKGPPRAPHNIAPQRAPIPPSANRELVVRDARPSGAPRLEDGVQGAAPQRRGYAPPPVDVEDADLRPWAHNLVQQFRDSRVQLAKQYAVKNAIVEGTGNVDPAKFGRALQGGAPLTDELRLMAEFQKAAPDVMRHVTKDAPMFTPWEASTIGMGGVAGYAAHPLGLGLMVSPLARSAARSVLASKAGNRALAVPHPQPAPGTPSQWMNAVPAGMNALGTGLYELGLYE